MSNMKVVRLYTAADRKLREQARQDLVAAIEEFNTKVITALSALASVQVTLTQALQAFEQRVTTLEERVKDLEQGGDA